jgi:hypothetical protein
MKGTWRGLSFAGDAEGYVEEGAADGHLSLGTPLGNLEEGSFVGNFERCMRWVSLSVRSRWETWERNPSIGNFKYSLKEGSGCGVSLSMGAISGEPGGGLLC